jgi:hypothetical protein
MAEIQWVIEVRCVNTLLADFKIGERGQHICVHVPDRDLDPHEFDKLVRAAREAARIAAEHRGTGSVRDVSRAPAPLVAELGRVGEVEGRTDLYQIQVLASGEIVSVDIPGAILGPSELDQFVAELETIQSRLAAWKE